MQSKCSFVTKKNRPSSIEQQRSIGSIVPDMSMILKLGRT